MTTTHLDSKSDSDVEGDASPILVVDDDVTTVRVVKKFLNKAGFFNVATITDSRETLDSIVEFRPAMVLLDIFMPHIDGLEILQQIRRNSELDNVVVLMLSSAGKEERFRSLEMGAIGFIQKPVTGDELVDQVAKAFRVARRFGAF